MRIIQVSKYAYADGMRESVTHVLDTDARAIGWGFNGVLVNLVYIGKLRVRL